MRKKKLMEGGLFKPLDDALWNYAEIYGIKCTTWRTKKNLEGYARYFIAHKGKIPQYAKKKTNRS